MLGGVIQTDFDLTDHLYQAFDQGIARGGLKRPEDAKLRLGQAMVLAGDAKAAGVLRSVTGADGTADIARMWAILARQRKS